MRINLVTYSDENMTISMERCIESAKRNGVEQVYYGEPFCIDEKFKEFNKDIFDGKRGAGCYWLFKPYMINLTMNQKFVEDGDIVIYSDAGIEFINNVNHIIEKMDEDIFFFSNGHRQIEWCKGLVMCAMLPGIYNSSDEEKESYKQAQASVIFFKVNQKTRDFVKEWLCWSQMPGFIDDSPSGLKGIADYKTFREHRHDQAILTALQIRECYNLHWWPARYNDAFDFARGEYTDQYPIMFLHHRMRNSEYENKVAV